MNLEKYISNLLEKNKFEKTEFFLSLKNGLMSKEKFLKTQKEFFHAVVGFSSPMAIVASQIPEPDLRFKIVKNLWEEHGEGDLKQAHGATFIEFLKRLKLENYLPSDTPGLPTQVFLFSLKGLALQQKLLGVSSMGMIERMFADISQFIGSSVIENGWMSEDQMIHYSLHQELDCIHAQDFFSILENEWNDPFSCEVIKTGLIQGQRLFLDYYQFLFDSSYEI